MEQIGRTAIMFAVAGGEWIAVTLYGTIKDPVKGYEHKTIGLSLNHL